MAQDGNLEQHGVSHQDFADGEGGLQEKKRRISTYSVIHKMTGHDPTAQTHMTYVLSASSLTVLQSRFVLDTLKSLLGRPKTHIILLVPLKLVVHTTTMKLTAVSKAAGSNIHIFPFDPMKTIRDGDVVSSIQRVAKVKRVDGCMSFEEDGESRQRIRAVVKLLNG
jgi:hypothetical protein